MLAKERLKPPVPYKDRSLPYWVSQPLDYKFTGCYFYMKSLHVYTRRGKSHCILSLQKYSVAIEARSRMLELVPPGRVIFLRPLKTNNVRTSWDAVWVKAEEVIREVS